MCFGIHINLDGMRYNTKKEKLREKEQRMEMNKFELNWVD